MLAKTRVPLHPRGQVHDLSPDPVTVASVSHVSSNGFWMPDGSSTVPCHLQQTKPVYFKSNEAFPGSYFVKLHNDVVSCGTYNYCGAKIPLRHSNLNMPYWREMLTDYHDTDLCDFLEFGWPLGLDPSVELKSTLRNHSSSIQFSDDMDKFIIKQIGAAALSGPFIINPFENICVSPMMTVPKKPSGRRVVIDASFGEGPNSGTPKGDYLGDSYTFNFPKVDEYAEIIRKLGPGCLLWKRDLKNYFLQLMVDPTDFPNMCLVWRNFLFFFTGMMFGFRNSGQAGQRTTTGVVYIFKKNSRDLFQKEFNCLNYSDDLAGAEIGDLAWTAFNYMSQLLISLGLAESLDKAFSPSTCMEYLGVEFDSVAMEKRVTMARVQELDSALDEWLVKIHATKRELQSILHKLLWIVSCVKNSRLFVSRIIAELRRLDKNHHRVKLSNEIRKDFRWFKCFLQTFNGVELIEDGDWSNVDDMEACGDACPASGGAYVGDEYFSRAFPSFLVDEPIHIKEFHVVLLSVKLWGHNWARKKIIIRCDNDAVCDTIFLQKPTDEKMQACLRELLFWQCRFNFSLSVQKIGTKENFLADYISRCTDPLKIDEFFNSHNVPMKKQITVPDDLFLFSGDW